MFDLSGISLSASDPNPSIDQYDDGGSSTDWSGVVSSAGQWGTELASVIMNRPVAYAPNAYGAPTPIGAPGSYVGNSPPMSNNTKLLMVVLGVATAVALIHFVGSH
jgi:hypothetical protein